MSSFALRFVALMALAVSMFSLFGAPLATAATPNSIIVTGGGGGQSAKIAATFSAQLTVQVLDNGNPNKGVPGVTVTFTAPASGASAIFLNNSNSASSTATTDANGFASSGGLLANTKLGSYLITASAAGGTNPQTNASFTNTVGDPAALQLTGGNGQTIILSQQALTALQVTVLDIGSNPVPSVSVTFTAPTSGATGTFSSGSTASATTSSGGIATAPTFTANATAGSYQVSATTSNGATAKFTLTNAVGPASLISANAGSPQSAVVSMPFGTMLRALVTDSGMHPVSGAFVLFQAPATGAGGTFTGGANAVAIQTDASGFATTGFTANGVPGAYSVVATLAADTTKTASFALTNTNASGNVAAAITANAGTPQSALTSTAFVTPLQALVTDGNNVPVPNVTVTFAAPASGAGGAFAGNAATATATTNMNGLATAPAFTANTTAGGYSVTASASGLAGNAVFSLTNSGPPTLISTKAGTPQTGTILTAFGTALQALVTDSASNPVSGISVTFQAPGGTASGTFPGAAATATVVTNGAGIATAPAFTANGQSGSYAVTASVTGTALSSASFLLTNAVGSASTVVATTGTPQSTQVTTLFATQLQATVKDTGGNPIPGVSVTFTATAAASGASARFAGGLTAVTVTTGPTGIAMATALTANKFTGTYAVNASVAGNPTQAVFTLTNTAGPAATVLATSGTPQSKVVSTAFGALTARAIDANGNPVPGASISFMAPASGASGAFASSAVVVSDANGYAVAPTFTANATTGSYAVSASTTGATPAAFALTNTSAGATQIAPQAGTPQSAPVLAVFGIALRAVVTDQGGNPVAGVAVTFTAPGSGASGIFNNGTPTVTVATNTAGVAMAPAFRANTISGPYTVLASAPGTASPASFALTNVSGAPADPTPIAGTPQSTVVSTLFATALQVKVVDAGNNPVAGAAVTFQAPASGASGTFSGGGIMAIATTDGAGVATAPSFTSNATAGSYQVTATSPGVVPPAIFALTNIPNGGLTVAVTANGKDGAFNFQASPALGTISSFTITTSGGAANQSFANLTGGYTVTLGQLQFGYKLKSISCTNGTTSSSASVSVTLTPSANVTCTFAIDFNASGIRTATQAAISTFLRNRADTIVGSEPQATRGDGRFTGSLFGGPLNGDDTGAIGTTQSGFAGSAMETGRELVTHSSELGFGASLSHTPAAPLGQSSDGGSAFNPVSLSGSTDDFGGGALSGFVSLNDMRKAAAQRDAEKAKAAGLSFNDAAQQASLAAVSRFNVWAEFQSNYYRSNYSDSRSGASRVGYLGMDYLVNPAILLGTLVQIDWANESGSGVSAGGTGWMVGPYVAIKLLPNLNFDARAAWGQSNNFVNPFGLSDESFLTDRELVSARLSGDWKKGNWRFSPEASVVYFTDTQKSYTDPYGVFIPSQAVTLGRVTAGPEVGYTFRDASGATVEPYLGLKGLYDFSQSSVVAPDGTLTAPATFRGKVESGIKVRLPSGVSVQGDASYDGIGVSTFSDIQGRMNVVVPLN